MATQRGYVRDVGIPRVVGYEAYAAAQSPFANQRENTLGPQIAVPATNPKVTNTSLIITTPIITTTTAQGFTISPTGISYANPAAVANLSAANSQVKYFQGLINQLNSPNYGLGPNATAQQLQTTLNNLNSEIFITVNGSSELGLNYYQGQVAQLTPAAQPIAIASISGTNTILTGNTIPQTITGNVNGINQTLGTVQLGAFLSGGNITFKPISFAPQAVTISGQGYYASVNPAFNLSTGSISINPANYNFVTGNVQTYTNAGGTFQTINIPTNFNLAQQYPGISFYSNGIISGQNIPVQGSFSLGTSKLNLSILENYNYSSGFTPNPTSLSNAQNIANSFFNTGSAAGLIGGAQGTANLFFAQPSSTTTFNPSNTIFSNFFKLSNNKNNKIPIALSFSIVTPSQFQGTKSTATTSSLANLGLYTSVTPTPSQTNSFSIVTPSQFQGTKSTATTSSLANLGLYTSVTPTPSQTNTALGTALIANAKFNAGSFGGFTLNGIENYLSTKPTTVSYSLKGQNFTYSENISPYAGLLQGEALKLSTNPLTVPLSLGYGGISYVAQTLGTVSSPYSTNIQKASAGTILIAPAIIPLGGKVFGEGITAGLGLKGSTLLGQTVGSTISGSIIGAGLNIVGNEAVQPTLNPVTIAKNAGIGFAIGGSIGFLGSAGSALADELVYPQASKFAVIESFTAQSGPSQGIGEVTFTSGGKTITVNEMQGNAASDISLYRVNRFTGLASLEKTGLVFYQTTALTQGSGAENLGIAESTNIRGQVYNPSGKVLGNLNAEPRVTLSYKTSDNPFSTFVSGKGSLSSIIIPTETNVEDVGINKENGYGIAKGNAYENLGLEKGYVYNPPLSSFVLDTESISAVRTAGNLFIKGELNSQEYVNILSKIFDIESPIVGEENVLPKGSLASYNGKFNVIKVLPTEDIYDLQDSLLHETFHAVINNYDINLGSTNLENINYLREEFGYVNQPTKMAGQSIANPFSVFSEESFVGSATEYFGQSNLNRPIIFQTNEGFDYADLGINAKNPPAVGYNPIVSTNPSESIGSENINGKSILNFQKAYATNLDNILSNPEITGRVISNTKIINIPSLGGGFLSTETIGEAYTNTGMKVFLKGLSINVNDVPIAQDIASGFGTKGGLFALSSGSTFAGVAGGPKISLTTYSSPFSGKLTVLPGEAGLPPSYIQGLYPAYLAPSSIFGSAISYAEVASPSTGGTQQGSSSFIQKADKNGMVTIQKEISATIEKQSSITATITKTPQESSLATKNLQTHKETSVQKSKTAFTSLSVRQIVNLQGLTFKTAQKQAFATKQKQSDKQIFKQVFPQVQKNIQPTRQRQPQTYPTRQTYPTPQIFGKAQIPERTTTIKNPPPKNIGRPTFTPPTPPIQIPHFGGGLGAGLSFGVPHVFRKRTNQKAKVAPIFKYVNDITSGTLGIHARGKAAKRQARAIGLSRPII